MRQRAMADGYIADGYIRVMAERQYFGQFGVSCQGGRVAS